MAKHLKIQLPQEAFNAIYLHEVLNDKSRIQILFGGSSSGKSKFKAQATILDLLNGGRNFLCVRNTGNTLRTSIFNELKKVIIEWGLLQLFNIRETDMDIICRNGYSALSKGLDDVEKLKSITPPKGVITDIWIEEATESSEDDFKQLEKRLRGEVESGIQKRITLTFNPILKSHWIFKRFFSGWTDQHKVRRADGVLILKTTYKDNRFLAPDDIKALEGEKDEYYRQVYVLGNWGVLGDVIFRNLEIMDLRSSEIFKTFDIFRNGLDFGFSVDPSAFNRLYYYRPARTLYIVDEWNSLGCTNDVIAKNLKRIVSDQDIIICDSAEPKSIAELNILGLNCRGAYKGKDSVSHGIQWLQQQKIVIDASLQSTINDFQGYHWKKDKHGERLPIPSDAFSHHPDAVRYACEDLVFEAPADSVYAAPSQVSAAQSSYEAIQGGY